MTMTIKLDTTGLRALISENPEFKVEITKAVMNNIRDDVVVRALGDKLNALLDDMVEYRWAGQSRVLAWKTPQFQKLVLDTIAEHTGSIINKAATDAANDWLNTTGRLLLTKHISDQGQAILDQIIPDSMIQELLEKKVQRVFAAMAAN